MSITDDIRNHLASVSTEESVNDVALAVGVTNKQASATLRRLVKNGEVFKSEANGYTLVSDEPPVEEDEDLIGDEAPADTSEAVEQEETLFYEYLDFPGNYSIVMAPFAVEIADAAGVPAKVETFKGKLTRRVHFGGTDTDLAARVVSLIQEEAAAAHEHLKAWQKENLERRRGLTDMQRYIEHRQVLADHGHKVARQVKKNGV